MPDTDLEELKEVTTFLRAANEAIPPGSTLASAKSAIAALLVKESGAEDPSAEKVALLVDCVIEVAKLVSTVVGAAALATAPPTVTPVTVTASVTVDSGQTPELPPETPAVPLAEEPPQ